MQAGLLVGGQKFNGAGVILTESALDDILAESVKLKPNVTMNKTIYGYQLLAVKFCKLIFA